jgi:uncharacterized membrane protein HdeD (DUF308 family)
LSGGPTTEVSVFTTGLGSFFASTQVSGISFSFPDLQNWSYGLLTLAVGILTILVSILVVYRPEDGGIITFILSFVNIPPSLFFLGRAVEIAQDVGQYLGALTHIGYTLVGSSYGYGIGYLIEIIGTFLLPVASIYIVSTATRMRTKPKQKTLTPPKDERSTN